MEDNKDLTVPYVVYESAQARADQRDKRKSRIILVMAILLFVLSLAYLIAWNLYDYSVETISYSQDGEGYNNINTGIQGDINNGAEIYSDEETAD